MMTDQEFVERVKRSIRRVSAHDIEVAHVGQGQIHLLAILRDRSEQQLVIAATRTVAGVTDVLADWN